MTAVLNSTTQLDTILRLQFMVAWAGEGLSEPSRMNWWRTDLVDPNGGGDLFRRLLPKTHSWASLESVREAAIQVDQRKRAELAQSDRIRSLFFWGATLDEQLAERLDTHKQYATQSLPETILDLPFSLQQSFNQDAFAAFLRLPDGTVNFKVAPAGREIKIEPADTIDLCAKKLAAALIPLSPDYPMPFYRLETL